MDPLTEVVLLLVLVVGVPAFSLRWLCGAITRHISSLAPERREPRFHLVTVIPQPARVE